MKISLYALFFTALLLLNACEPVEEDTDPNLNTNELKDAEDKTVKLINDYRVSIGKKPFEYNEAIYNACLEHSQSMATNKTAFGHDGFKERVDKISKRMSLSSAAENVAKNQGFSDPAQTAYSGWLKSPGHKTNIEGDYTHAAIAVAKAADGTFFFTQIFVKE
ncbi:MAG: CAP domain-containing protein [Cytophagales bacterium]|nr:MAG: CAP domain-containing protein [Cytophagales bacterium]TAF59971.1 MAG: CAP domain-containing protein [Cytophagales bacterium]